MVLYHLKKSRSVRIFAVVKYCNLKEKCTQKLNYFKVNLKGMENGFSNISFACVLRDFQKTLNTVEPLLSGPLLSGHPLFNGHFSKSRNISQSFTENWPSIKRPPLLSGRGHPWAVRNSLFFCYLPVLSGHLKRGFLHFLSQGSRMWYGSQSKRHKALCFN